MKIVECELNFIHILTISFRVEKNDMSVLFILNYDSAAKFPSVLITLNSSGLDTVFRTSAMTAI